MASTIKIKRSGVAGKQPNTSTLSVGELAINYKDQKLYSSNGTAIFELTSAGGGGGGSNTVVFKSKIENLQTNNFVVTNVSSPSGNVYNITLDNYVSTSTFNSALANTNSYIVSRSSWTALTGTNTALRTLISDRLQVANASTLYATKSNPTTSGVLAHTGRATISTNLTVSGNATVSGTMTATGIVSGSELHATNASGDEGGEIKLTKPPNGTLDGGITIDAYQNRIRFFEQGGSARGAYINLADCAGGVGTNLLAGGSTTQYLQVANAVATYATKAYAAANSYVKSTLANTNSYIATRASWNALTSTNTAIRSLVSDRLQVANASSIYQTKAVERAALANTNAYIATRASTGKAIAMAIVFG